MFEPLNRSVNDTKRQAGFTLLELTVVVAVISILFLFSYQRYLDLLVDVERSSVEQTLGVLRSALGMKVAKMIVDGRMDELNGYEGMNPVQLLAELPKNYEGEIADPQALNDYRGIWYFDKMAGMLVYRVKNRSAFFSEIADFDQARFRVAVINDKDNKNSFAGLSLRPVEKYSWFERRY